MQLFRRTLHQPNTRRCESAEVEGDTRFCRSSEVEEKKSKELFESAVVTSTLLGSLTSRKSGEQVKYLPDVKRVR